MLFQNFGLATIIMILEFKKFWKCYVGWIFISYERDQNWRGKYILLIEKKKLKKKNWKKKNVYPFQAKDG